MRIPDFTKYNLVSFDVFDTLLVRLVSNPKDVFRIVETLARKMNIHAQGFSEKRVVAEQEARDRAKSEVTLDDIYSILGKSLPVDNETIESLKNLELQTERNVCVAKPSGKELYNIALASGVPIVITSDMYLSSAVITELLLANGYEGWSNMFVSCECGATKSSGALYSYILKQTGIRPSTMIHVGDNMRSDILRARMSGMKTLRVNAFHPQTHGLSESLVCGLQSSRSNLPEGNRKNFGYINLGPVVVGFCEWLASELKSTGIDKVFFLSRDGLIVQKTMERLKSTEHEGTYLHVSRRALQVPSFALLDSFTDIIQSMFLPRNVCLRKVFGKMGLDPDMAASIMTQAGIDPDIERTSSQIVSDAEAQRAYDLLVPYVKENSSKELSLLVEYLQQNDFTGHVAIVDIGWFGNMQVALERVVKATSLQTDIYGYYVGLSPDGQIQKTHHMKGYLFDCTHNRELFNQENNFNLIFETLFSAISGTTKGYKRYKNNIAPVLAEYEGIEREVGLEAEEMRVGALEFASDWARVTQGMGMQISPAVAMRSLNRMGVHPTLQEAEYFGDWAMEADGENLYAARPASLLYYIRHPKALFRDFSHASWNIGFLKRLFRLPFPYAKLWMSLHRLYKKYFNNCFL